MSACVLLWSQACEAPAAWQLDEMEQYCQSMRKARVQVLQNLVVPGQPVHRPAGLLGVDQHRQTPWEPTLSTAALPELPADPQQLVGSEDAAYVLPRMADGAG